jgi:hypothetical protein
MIGCWPANDHFKLRPEMVLWRWVVRVLAHCDASPAGGRTDMGGRCEQRVLPEVVALPPGDLIEQVRVGPAAQRCRGEDRVLEFLVLPAAECPFGQEPLPDPFQGSGSARLARHQSSASAAVRSKTSLGKVSSRASPGRASSRGPSQQCEVCAGHYPPRHQDLGHQCVCEVEPAANATHVAAIGQVVPDVLDHRPASPVRLGRPRCGPRQTPGRLRWGEQQRSCLASG